MKIVTEMRNRMPVRRLWAFCAATLLAAASVAAQQTYYPADRDSLRQLIAVTQGKEKLEAYKYLAIAYFFESTDDLKMDTMLAIYAQMDAEAQKQGNFRICGLIRHNILAAFHNVKKYDEIIRRAPVYLDFLEKNGVWNHYYNVYRSLIKAYTRSYQFDRALAESQIIYDKARELQLEDGIAYTLYAMAEVYEAQSRNEEAEDFLRRAVEQMKGDPGFYAILADAYYDLCQILLTMERYDEALTEIQEYEKLIRLYEENAKQEVPTARSNLFGCYARLYNNIGDTDKAEYYTNKLDSTAQTRVYKIMAYSNRAKIFRARAQYE